MKKKVVWIFGISLFAIVSLLYSTSMAKATYKFDGSGFGSFLNDQHEEQKTSHENDTEVSPKEEIERAKAFYIASGMDEKQAEEMAGRYYSEYSALYKRAIALGYDVSDEEVEAYVQKLKDTIHSPEMDNDSFELYKSIVNEFESEEAYWEYEKEIYKKALPIQKMNYDMEMEFFRDNPEANSEEWAREFVKIKENILKEYKEQ